MAVARSSAGSAPGARPAPAGPGRPRECRRGPRWCRGGTRAPGRQGRRRPGPSARRRPSARREVEAGRDDVEADDVDGRDPAGQQRPGLLHDPGQGRVGRVGPQARLGQHQQPHSCTCGSRRSRPAARASSPMAAASSNRPVRFRQTPPRRMAWSTIRCSRAPRPISSARGSPGRGRPVAHPEPVQAGHDLGPGDGHRVGGPPGGRGGGPDLAAGQPVEPARGQGVPQPRLVHHGQVAPPGPLGEVQRPQRHRDQRRLVLQHPAGLLQLPADRGRLGRPLAPVLAPLHRAARPQPPQRPPQDLAAQHVRPPEGGRREPVAEQGQGTLEVLPGRAHLAQLHVGRGEQAVPAGPERRRDLAAPEGGAEDGLGLPEPALAPVLRPEPLQVAVELRRVGVGDQPVGGGPEVLDVGVQVHAGGRRPVRVGEQAENQSAWRRRTSSSAAGSAARRWAAYWRSSSCMP